MASEKAPHDNIEMPRDETSHDVQCPHDSKKRKRESLSAVVEPVLACPHCPVSRGVKR
jgi:hypothetical protein